MPKVIMQTGRYRVTYDDGRGYGVFRRGKFFWQQVGHWYTYAAWAMKYCRKRASEDECKNV